MALCSTEREQFLRNAILVVDTSKDVVVCLLETYLTTHGLSFEDFINRFQHDIYHLFISNQCCQCKGKSPPKSQRVLFQEQMELLLDEGNRLSNHNTKSTADFCCCTAKRGVSMDVLDLTFATLLITNLCLDYFWDLILFKKGISLEDFLNQNIHDIFHLWQGQVQCCKCQATYTYPTNKRVIRDYAWKLMFLPHLPLCKKNHKRLAGGASNDICSFIATFNIGTHMLDRYTAREILKNKCPLMSKVCSLTQIRNTSYGHAKDGKMSNSEYKDSVSKLEDAIRDIAKHCGTEREFNVEMCKVKYDPIDMSIYEKYRNSLFETHSGFCVLLDNVQELENDLLGKHTKKLKKMAAITDEVCEMKKFVHSIETSVGEVNSRFQKMKYYTHLEIQQHISQGNYVATNAETEILENFETCDVFIITGTEGTGKSSLGLQILYILQENSDFSVIKLTDLNDAKDAIQIKGKLALLLDDIFVPTHNFKNCLYDVNKVSSNVFKILDSLRSNRKLKLFLTCTSLHRKLLSDVFQTHDLFNEMLVVDLSSIELRLNEVQKEQILRSHCKKNEIDLNWSENVSNCKNVLEKKVFYKIVEIEPVIGFPKACSDFTMCSDYFLLRARFFTHPTQALVNDLICLRDLSGRNESVLLFPILAYVLLKGNCLKMNSIIKETMNEILQHCSVHMNKSIAFSKVKRCAWLLDPMYLYFDEKAGEYNFRDQMTAEAVTVAYFDLDPEAVLKIASFDFIKHVLQIPNDEIQKNIVTIVLPDDKYKLLAERLKVILLSEYGDCPFKFVEMLCESRIFSAFDEKLIDTLISELTFEFTEEFCLPDLKLEGTQEKVLFYFPAVLLFYVCVKQKTKQVIKHLSEYIKGKLNNLDAKVMAATSKILKHACQFLSTEVDLCYPHTILTDLLLHVNY